LVCHFKCCRDILRVESLLKLCSFTLIHCMKNRKMML
jgi:hypothetical protein